MIYRKCWIVLFVMSGITISSLRGQVFTAPLQAYTTGTNPADFEFRADGTMIAKGNAGVGSLLSSDQGAGTRLLWFPSLGAFRAGTVTGTDWDSSQIGVNSVAMGMDNVATGTCSIALGYNNNVPREYGFAAGTGNLANQYSVALGLSCTAVSWGGQAVAIGQNATAGYQSVAMGYGSSSLSNWSFTAAGGSTPSGHHSVALGPDTALGQASFAAGVYSTAAGNQSIALGYDCYAASYGSMAVGSANIGGGNPTAWVATDPLFEIGDGQWGQPSDAMIVYKNGNAGFQGVVTVAPGGDIPMYSGN